MKRPIFLLLCIFANIIINLLGFSSSQLKKINICRFDLLYDKVGSTRVKPNFGFGDFYTSRPLASQLEYNIQSAYEFVRGSGV